MKLPMPRRSGGPARNKASSHGHGSTLLRTRRVCLYACGCMCAVFYLLVGNLLIFWSSIPIPWRTRMLRVAASEPMQQGAGASLSTDPRSAMHAPPRGVLSPLQPAHASSFLRPEHAQHVQQAVDAYPELSSRCWVTHSPATGSASAAESEESRVCNVHVREVLIFTVRVQDSAFSKTSIGVHSCLRTHVRQRGFGDAVSELVRGSFGAYDALLHANRCLYALLTGAQCRLLTDVDVGTHESEPAPAAARDASHLVREPAWSARWVTHSDDPDDEEDLEEEHRRAPLRAAHAATRASVRLTPYDERVARAHTLMHAQARKDNTAERPPAWAKTPLLLQALRWRVWTCRCRCPDARPCAASVCVSERASDTHTCDDAAPPRAVRRYKWVMMLDADAFITRFDDDGQAAGPLQSLITEAEAMGADLVLTVDSSGINTGAMLVRNSPWTRSLLRRAWNETSFIHHPFWEQAAIAHLLLRDRIAVRERVMFVPQRRINGYAPDGLVDLARGAVQGLPADSPGAWHPGDFVLHFAGLSPGAYSLVLQNMSGILPAAWPTHAGCGDIL